MRIPKIYFAETKRDEQKRLLCRWVEHFYEEGRKVQVVTDGTLNAQQLDQMLWTFSQSSFIPHRIVHPQDQRPWMEPVVITVGEVLSSGHEVLVCDIPVSPDFMGRYSLVLHFVLLDDMEQRKHSRILWQSARDRGLFVQHVPYSSAVSVPSLSPPHGMPR